MIESVFGGSKISFLLPDCSTTMTGTWQIFLLGDKNSCKIFSLLHRQYRRSDWVKWEFAVRKSCFRFTEMIAMQRIFSLICCSTKRRGLLFPSPSQVQCVKYELNMHEQRFYHRRSLSVHVVVLPGKNEATDAISHLQKAIKLFEIFYQTEIRSKGRFTRSINRFEEREIFFPSCKFISRKQFREREYRGSCARLVETIFNHGNWITASLTGVSLKLRQFNWVRKIIAFHLCQKPWFLYRY